MNEQERLDVLNDERNDTYTEKESSVTADTESQQSTDNEVQLSADEAANENIAANPDSDSNNDLPVRKKKRTPRKKKEITEDQDGNEDDALPIPDQEDTDDAETQNPSEQTAPFAEYQTVESPDNDEVLENQMTIPLFTLSADGFFMSYQKQDTDSDAEFTAASDDDSDDEDEIIPPDEIFAYRNFAKTKEDSDIIPTEDEDESPEDEPISSDAEDDENIGEDGQYALPDLDMQTMHSEKSFSDENSDGVYDPKKPRRIDGRFDLTELFVFTLLAVMLVTTFFFRHSVVDGSSMENTLHGGEHLIISDFFYTPKRGDIVVCEAEINGEIKPIVKRVIAVAGDHVRVTEYGDVYVNGVLLEEDYVFIDGSNYGFPVDTEVYENEIFVMGDHRNVSADSREIGKIKVDAVLGKVLLRFYPFDKFGAVN